MGKHIFDKVIGPRGLLRKKTRVLVTHGISYLPYMSNVIVMRDGEIIETGTYKELIEKKVSKVTLKSNLYREYSYNTHASRLLNTREHLQNFCPNK